MGRYAQRVPGWSPSLARPRMKAGRLVVRTRDRYGKAEGFAVSRCCPGMRKIERSMRFVKSGKAIEQSTQAPTRTPHSKLPMFNIYPRNCPCGYADRKSRIQAIDCVLDCGNSFPPGEPGRQSGSDPPADCGQQMRGASRNGPTIVVGAGIRISKIIVISRNTRGLP